MAKRAKVGRVAPRCMLCGKRLRPRTYSVEVPHGTEAPTEVYGAKVVEIVSRRPLFYRRGDQEAPPDAISVWCGSWGSYGDNRFCGLRCGYRYAVRTTKPPG